MTDTSGDVQEGVTKVIGKPMSARPGGIKGHDMEGTLNFHIAEAKKIGNPNAATYFENELKKLQAGKAAKAARAAKRAGVKP